MPERESPTGLDRQQLIILLGVNEVYFKVHIHRNSGTDRSVSKSGNTGVHENPLLK